MKDLDKIYWFFNFPPFVVLVIGQLVDWLIRSRYSVIARHEAI